jgi:peptidoglycan/LPS O-acetylase OafA/YrhL
MLLSSQRAGEPGTASARPYLPALTGFRAVAAGLVFFYHFNPFSLRGLPGRLLDELHIGVTLFFVLSGFLIGLRYADRVQLTWPWLRAYFYRRFVRIYPLYFLLTCAYFTVYQLAPSYDTNQLYTTSHAPGKALILLLNITLLRSWFKEFWATGIIPGWTLTVEEFFYLLAPLLLLGLRRRPARLPLYTIGFLLLGCALVALPAPFHRFGFVPSYSFMLSATFFGRCFEFLGGSYAALLWLRPAAGPRWLARCKACTALGGAWVLGCLGLLVLTKLLPWQEPYVEGSRVFINNLLLVPGIGLLLYGLATESTRASRLLASRLFGLLGKASYAFYLVHAGVFAQFLTLHVTTNLTLRLLITIALAIALYLGIERPLHRLLMPRRAPAA